MKKFFVLLSLLLVLPLAQAENDDNGVVPIEMKMSGLVRFVDDFGRAIFDVDLKGNPGAATGRGVAISGSPVGYADLPAGNACVNLDSVAGGSGVYITAAQIVLTFHDGSMIWGNSLPDGYVCFSGFAYGPYEIMGGSARFEGATGWVAVEIDTHGFPPPLPRLVTPETGNVTGEIVLP